MKDYEKPLVDKNGNPLKLLEAASHHCIRCVKKARALQQVGYEVHGMGHKVAFGTNIYDTYQVWQNEAQFKNSIRFYINAGITGITYNNEPDKPALWIREVINEMGVQDKVKLITDLHDLDSIRKNIIPIDEREMFNSSDGFIYVSLPIQEITNKLHQVAKPNIVLYSYCNRGVAVFNEEDIPKRKGVVYEGGANPPNDERLNKEFSYRDIHNIIKKIVEMGNELHMYCGNFTAYQTYHGTGAVLYPPTDYRQMMDELVRYKYGLIVFNNKDGKQNQVNYTLTNKESEYLHAGLPSLVCWSPETEKHVRKHGTGFVFSDIEEIGNCSQLESLYFDVMQNIKVKREQLCMENYIVLVENLYAELLGLEKKGIPDNIKKLHDFEFKA